MDAENLTIESISSAKLANIQQQFSVKILSSANSQSTVAGQLIAETIAKLPHPDTGKGQKLNVVA